MKGDHGLWQDLEFYLAARRTTLETFRKRCRLDVAFLEKLHAGTVPDTDPGAARVRRIVAFGPDLRRRREALHVTLRTLATQAGISPSRLSRAERLLAELTPSEKRRIKGFLADVEKKRALERQAAHRRQVAIWLRTSRSNRGLTQDELAKELGCERKAIIRWEKDGSVPGWQFPRLQSILPAFLPPADQ